MLSSFQTNVFVQQTAVFYFMTHYLSWEYVGLLENILLNLENLTNWHPSKWQNIRQPIENFFGLFDSKTQPVSKNLGRL